MLIFVEYQRNKSTMNIIILREVLKRINLSRRLGHKKDIKTQRTAESEINSIQIYFKDGLLNHNQQL